MFRDGPGSISPDLFWRRRDSLTLLPMAETKRGRVFAPPDDLIDVLNLLLEPAGSDPTDLV